MITGLIEPTSGNGTYMLLVLHIALVMGYSILTEMDDVHKYIGVCPQFDILWPTLTAKEHLLFYARLKGVQASQEELHVVIVLLCIALIFLDEFTQ